MCGAMISPKIYIYIVYKSIQGVRHPCNLIGNMTKNVLSIVEYKCSLYCEVHEVHEVWFGAG